MVALATPDSEKAVLTDMQENILFYPKLNHFIGLLIEYRIIFVDYAAKVYDRALRHYKAFHLLSHTVDIDTKAVLLKLFYFCLPLAAACD